MIWIELRVEDKTCGWHSPEVEGTASEPAFLGTSPAFTTSQLWAIRQASVHSTHSFPIYNGNNNRIYLVALLGITVQGQCLLGGEWLSLGSFWGTAMKVSTLMQPNTIHKNKLKMDQRSKCEVGYYKTLRRKHRQNTLWHKSQQDLFGPTS